MKIEELDKNFIVNTKIGREDIEFIDSTIEPFKFYGIIYENNKFRRIPQKIADSISDGVSKLNTNTSGGRIRFITDSPYIAISVINDNPQEIGSMASHMTVAAICGFDIYSRECGKEVYQGTFMPPYNMAESYENIIYFPSSKRREITINFPLYSDVSKLYIGIQKGSALLPPNEYQIAEPIVYYGSSITQGACVTRPGCIYQNIISRDLNCDYLNLGFSGNAKAEKTIANYIAKLKMSVFIFNYDHNATDVDFLNATHQSMFNIIRQSNPYLPIIITSRPKKNLNDDELKRLNIIKKTYQSAVKNGDSNVYFIPGNKIYDEQVSQIALVDNCHPADVGALYIAKKIEKELKRILL